MDNKYIYHHDYFGHLTKEDLDIYFDFIGEVIYNLNGFDVWVAENIFNENDSKKYDKEIIERYELLLELRDELEDKLYGDD